MKRMSSKGSVSIANCARGKSILSLAFYLPQFHAIPENNAWWGEGFTEWTHLKSWSPKFRGHHIRQPIAPLGQYNLLNPQIFDEQMKIAQSHGIDGFAVWDYWFGNGERLLERPLELILNTDTNFRYCLAWANHTWFNKTKNILLRQQKYLGAADYERYFFQCARHFHTPNYVAIDGKPIFIIYDPSSIPDLDVFIDLWSRLALDSGFKGVYFIGDKIRKLTPSLKRLDGYSNGFGFWSLRKALPWNFMKEKFRTKLKLTIGGPQRFDYWTMVKDSIPASAGSKFVPTVFTGWDTTPRHGNKGVIFTGLTKDTFASHLENIASFVDSREKPESIILVKSWNEWAEGNLLEPDSLFGIGLLEIYKRFSIRFDNIIFKQTTRMPSTRTTIDQS